MASTSRIGSSRFYRNNGEFSQVMDFFRKKGIQFSKNQTVFSTNISDLEEVIKVCEKYGISYENGDLIFNKSAKDIIALVETCREFAIDYSKRSDVFFRTASEIRDLISASYEIGLNISDIDFSITGNELRRRNDVCQKYGIPYSSYIESRTNGDLVEIDGTRYLMAFDGETLISVYDATIKVEIPSFVKYISSKAFSKCNDVKEVIVPASVKDLGHSVFKGCNNLSSVTFLGELEELKKEMFENTSLSKIEWPKGLKIIGDMVFKNTLFGEKNGENYTIPDTVEEIGASAFENCPNLTSFSGSRTLKRVKENALKGCDNLLGIFLYDSCEEFDSNLFAGDNFQLFFFGDWMIPIYPSYKNRKLGFKNAEELAFNFYDFFEEEINILGHRKEGFYPKFVDYDLIDGEIEGADMILGEVVSLTKRDFAYSKIFKDFDYDTFASNVIWLTADMSLGIGIEDVAKIIVDENYGLLSTMIDEVYHNFNYLVKQDIVPYSVLKELYFGDAVGNTPEEMLKDYFKKHRSFPELFSTLLVKGNDTNLLELRDRLVYVATMQLLDGHYSEENYDKAMAMLKRTLFSNIISEDKKAMHSINDGVYDVLEDKYPEMMGMMIPFYNKISGINKKWFNELFKEMKKGGVGTAFYDFYNSLTTIRCWNKISNEKMRATLLKNEIIGRLLYADIVLTMDGEKVPLKKHYDRYIEKKKEQLKTGNTIPIAELLKFSTFIGNKNFRNIYAIRTMLKIDPYSFDALRKEYDLRNEMTAKDVEAVNAKFAKTQGYVFSTEDFNRYKSLRNDSEFSGENVITSYIEYISNGIGLAKIPSEDKSGYLSNIRSMTKCYISEQSSDDLFKICRSLDLYLRSSNELYRGTDESELIAKAVFDKESNINNDARIMYCLYNLNRLAHNAFELNCKSAMRNKFRLALNDEISFDKMKNVFGAYNRLYSVGLDTECVDLLLDKNRIIYEDILGEDKLSDSDAARLLNRFRVNDVRKKIISEEEIEGIRSDLLIIESLNPEERKLIDVSILEQSIFFECKTLFSEEIMKRLVMDISDDIKSVMHADIDVKRKFYAEHGFIAEIQEDNMGNEVLVCLCESFNEPFSVHLKDLPEDISEQFRKSSKEKTIAHCGLNGKNISLRDDDFEEDLKVVSSDNNFVGFRGNISNLVQAIKSNYDNYDVPAKSIRVGLSSSEINDMFNDTTTKSTLMIGTCEVKK